MLFPARVSSVATIGIGGAVTRSPLPHHRTYGARIRRFRDLGPQGPGVRDTFHRWRFRRSQVPVGLHPIAPWQAQPRLIGWRMTVQENRVLLATITVRAFLTRVSTLPLADFCRRIRMSCPTLSHDSVTDGRSPEVSPTAFRAAPPNLRFAPLMEMGFAKPGPLAQRSRLISGFCSSARTFAPRFLQTPPHDDALALR
jgi:hypothetical protein